MKALLLILGQKIGIVFETAGDITFVLEEDMQKPTEKRVVLVIVVAESGDLFKLIYPGTTGSLRENICVYMCVPASKI